MILKIKPPLRCNYRSNNVGDSARKSRSVYLRTRNLLLLMMSMQQTWWVSLREFSFSLLEGEEHDWFLYLLEVSSLKKKNIEIFTMFSFAVKRLKYIMKMLP